MFVPKKDDTWRMFMDFQELRKNALNIHYSLPHIDDLLDRLKNATYFTNNVEVVIINLGFFKMIFGKHYSIKTNFIFFFVMPFGICNVPISFIPIIKDVYRKFTDDFEITYLDDILFFSKIWEDHVNHVRKVLYSF